jgi:quercetin dioxygenase-like cupin family protein
MYVVNQADLPLSNIAREFVGDDHGGIGITFLVVDAPPGRGPALHRHPYAEIFIVQEGEVTLTDGESERVIRAGDVAVVAAGRAARVHEHRRRPAAPDRHPPQPHFETEWL